RIIELFGLDIGQPLHESRQDAQPDPPERPAIGLDDRLTIARIGQRGAQIPDYQIPSSALASSEAMMRGSQRGVQTRLMSTSFTAGKALVSTACACVLITGPRGQAGVVRVMSMMTFRESSSIWTPYTRPRSRMLMPIS